MVTAETCARLLSTLGGNTFPLSACTWISWSAEPSPVCLLTWKRPLLSLTSTQSTSQSPETSLDFLRRIEMLWLNQGGKDLLVKQSYFRGTFAGRREGWKRRRGKILYWYDSVFCSWIKLTCYLLCLFQFLFTTWQTPTHPAHRHLGLQTASAILYNSSSHCELACFSSSPHCRILNLIIANITYLSLESAILTSLSLCRHCLDHLPGEAAPLHTSVPAPGSVSHLVYISNKPVTYMLVLGPEKPDEFFLYPSML